MSITKKLAMTASAALLATGAGIAADADPAAAASCYGGSCNNVDPNSTDCVRDARTIEDITVSTLRIELRYSPSCNAVWVRGSGQGTPVLRAYTDSSGRYLVAERVGPPANGSSSWTTMLSFNYWVKGCERFWGTCTRLR